VCGAPLTLAGWRNTLSRLNSPVCGAPLTPALVLRPLPRLLLYPSQDNEETATLNLDAMNKSPNPWAVSFSYGKALQKTTIVTWMGKPQNVKAAQAALLARAKANSEACFGKYVPGSCASVGKKGNVAMAGGAY
jgi:hypothetical protein